MLKKKTKSHKKKLKESFLGVILVALVALSVAVIIIILAMSRYCRLWHIHCSCFLACLARNTALLPAPLTLSITSEDQRNFLATYL
ncbi:hypothetical protein E2C01_089137 [Portunus trituberculatus]|uniref:Uncharacterized protein n=1 Tax=Portunus trituberculatus TaxID=210409 RepID=A0A5B7JLE7_PORTR|nr:hypothetical protein [Portunus trituberculatus]